MAHIHTWKTVPLCIIKSGDYQKWETDTFITVDMGSLSGHLVQQNIGCFSEGVCRLNSKVTKQILSGTHRIQQSEQLGKPPLQTATLRLDRIAENSHLETKEISQMCPQTYKFLLMKNQWTLVKTHGVWGSLARSCSHNTQLGQHSFTGLTQAEESSSFATRGADLIWIGKQKKTHS